MTPAWTAFLLVMAFGVLVATFASASRVVTFARPYIGIGLLISTFMTLFLDATVWFVAESLAVVLFFMLYPDREIRGLVAPIVVLAGIFLADLLLVGLFAVGVSVVLILEDVGFDFSDQFAGALAFTGFGGAIGGYIAYKGVRHLAPKFRLALRVLGQNV